MVRIIRREHFSAAHRLFLPGLSDEENFEIFGKCSNPNWHGHNYILYVTVSGEPDPETGLVIHLRHVSRLIDERVIRKIDHRNLNLEVDFMKDKIATTENLAVSIWEEIRPEVEKTGALLHCVRIEETENNSIEYYG